MAALKWCRAVRGLTFSQKAVLMCLSDHANAAGVSWPSHRTIAAELCSGVRTVGRALAALEGAGMISRDVVSCGSVIRYRLAVPLEPVTAEPDTLTPVTVTDPPRQSDGPPPVRAAGGSVRAADRSLSKPKKKPQRSKRPKARAGLPEGFDPDACLDAFADGYGSSPGSWLPDCTKCVIEHEGTDHTVTPEAVRAVAAWIRTWPSNDGTMTIQTLLWKTKWANYLEQARKWHKAGRPMRRNNPQDAPAHITPVLT